MIENEQIPEGTYISDSCTCSCSNGNDDGESSMDDDYDIPSNEFYSSTPSQILRFENKQIFHFPKKLKVSTLFHHNFNFPSLQKNGFYTFHFPKKCGLYTFHFPAKYGFYTFHFPKKCGLYTFQLFSFSEKI